MKSWSIGIAGGGIGGMTAALLLAGDGHRVTLHERSDRLGGRLAYAELGQSRIDQGPTIVLLPDMLMNSLREAGVDTSRVKLIRCDPMYRIHYADGSHFDKWSDEKRQLAEIARVFPGEQAGYAAYMHDLARLFPLGQRAFLDRPFLKKKHFFTRANVQLLLKLRAYRSVRARAAGYFRDARLIDAFSLQTLYIGGLPHATPALYSFIPYAEHAFGIWYVQGGYASLLPLLQEALEKRGVQVKLHSNISGIRLKDGGAAGFETIEGYAPYDAVVFNGDMPHLQGLLTGMRRSPPRSYKPSSGCLLLYAETNRSWPDAPGHQFFLPERFDLRMRELLGSQRLPDDPAYYVFNPAQLDTDAAPPGASMLYVMIPVPPASSQAWQGPEAAARARGLIDRVLADLERRAMPGLRGSIVRQSMRSPPDAAREGLFEGGSFGIAPTIGQSGAFRPQLQPFAIERLYAVGASVHPGGGIPIVMQGARLLADKIREETV
jgi:phytoene desaturase